MPDSTTCALIAAVCFGGGVGFLVGHVHGVLTSLEDHDG